jgi:hypothetical protein
MVAGAVPAAAGGVEEPFHFRLGEEVLPPRSTVGLLALARRFIATLYITEVGGP